MLIFRVLKEINLNRPAFVKELFFYFLQKDRVNELKQQAGALQTKIVELQKSPFAKTKQDDTLEEL